MSSNNFFGFIIMMVCLGTIFLIDGWKFVYSDVLVGNNLLYCTIPSNLLDSDRTEKRGRVQPSASFLQPRQKQ